MKQLLHTLALALLPFWAVAGPGDVQFVPNQGQWSEPFLYKGGVGNCDIYLEKGSITYLLADAENGDKVHEYKHDKSVPPTLKYHAYRMIFEGANPAVTTKGAESFETYYNYYIGNDQSKWKSGVHPFGTVTYNNLYPGIDALIKTDKGNFAYDFIIAPNADAGQVKLRFEGADKLELKDGKLIIHNSVKAVEESAPYTYQIVNGEKKEVKCAYVLNGSTVSFAFPEGYDKSLPLVIDPSVVFVTYSGSPASNYGFTATYDAQGNAYGGGEVFAAGYPTTTGAFQMVFAGGMVDVNISKYSSNGTQHLYSTYLGGTLTDQPHSMVVDNAGNLVVTGKTNSVNFPTTTGAFDVTHNGQMDLFVAKLSSTGTTLLGSTYVGGSNDDGSNGPIAPNYGDEHKGEVLCDNIGNIYVAGNTKSTNFPTVNATQTSLNGTMDGVAIKLNSDLTSMAWGTYLGGSGNDNAMVLAFSTSGNYVYVAGGTQSSNFPTMPGGYLSTYQGGTVDGYVARFQNGGSYPLMNTSFVGTNSYDQSYGLQVDVYNGVYIMGQTQGAFPTIGSVYNNPGSSQFILKLDSTLSTVQFSTVFGNGATTSMLAPNAFMVDDCLNIYFSGFGTQQNLPVTLDAFQSTLAGGASSDFYFFVTGPNAGSLLFASYYGANGNDHVDGGTSRFDKTGIIYQGICTSAGTFPGSNTGFYPNNLSSWNLLTMKIDFDIDILNAVASANNVSGCAPLNVQFQNTSVNATTFTWDFGDGSPVSTATNPTHLYTIPGTYTVMLAANSTFTCNFNDTTYITVVVDTGAVISNFTYQKVDTCGPFSATFTNTSAGSNSTQYSWTFGDNTSSNLQQPGLHTYPGSGTYTVTLIAYDSLSFCGQRDTVVQVINFNPPGVVVTVNPSPNARGCAPFTVQFQDGSTGGNTYWWNFGDGSPANTQQAPSYTYTQAGTYNVTFIAGNSSGGACGGPDTGYLVITVDTGIINADFTAVITDSCDEFNVSIINTSAPVSPTTVFTWYFGDGTSFATQHPVSHSYGSSGTYTITLIVEDSLSCNKIDSISKTITFTQQYVDAVAPPFPDVCAVSDVHFSHSSTNVQSVYWTLGDGSTSTQNSFTHHYNDFGEYNIMLIATNELACNKSDTFTGKVHIRRRAIADFNYTPIIPERNAPIDFVNLSQYADTYLWDFGDGTTSTEVDPSKMYDKTFLFNICLTANNKDNCPDSICRTAQTDISALIDLPTAFTPDGDGINDIFLPRGIGVETVNLKIFNRWGTLVFESDSMDHGWDGIYNGTEQPMEAYAYVLRATFITGEHFQRQGNVTLIR